MKIRYDNQGWGTTKKSVTKSIPMKRVWRMKDLTTHRLDRRQWELKYLTNVAVFCRNIQGVKILQAVHCEMY
jgi:transcriptional regulator of met regulon